MLFRSRVSWGHHSGLHTGHPQRGPVTALRELPGGLGSVNWERALHSCSLLRAPIPFHSGWRQQAQQNQQHPCPSRQTHWESVALPTPDEVGSAQTTEAAAHAAGACYFTHSSKSSLSPTRGTSGVRHLILEGVCTTVSKPSQCSSQGACILV